MTDYPTFSAFLRERYGSHWVLARRLTDALKRRNYEVAISPKRYDELQDEWASAHPLVAYARASLPAGPLQGDAMAAIIRHVRGA